jgi:hypothetical protein
MPSTVELVCVAPDRIHDIWSHAAPRIRSAIERTGLSDFAELEQDVLRGGQLLWLAWDGETIEAAATTHLTMVGPRKVCVITSCAGEHKERWLPLLSHIERYAKAEGCAIMRIFGRHGWQRVLSGYEVSNVVMDKEL